MTVVFSIVSMAPKNAADRREQDDNAHQKKDEFHMFIFLVL
jgi:hypothetical protein